jgi:phosphoribosylformylglycinamidine synthase
MLPWEILVSESQERMFFVVKTENVAEIQAIFNKYELPHEVIGEVTTSGRCVVHQAGKPIVDLPAHLLTKPPVAKRKAIKPTYLEQLDHSWLPPIPKSLTDICRKIMLSDNIISREWVYRQYDHEVGLYSVLKSGQADAGVFKLTGFETKKGIAVTFDGNSQQVYLDPFNGGAGVMMEACCNIVATGAEPIAMTDCLNFGNPEHPDIYWTFIKAVEGIAKMAKTLSIPCVGGNVSFYNHDEVNNIAVKPSPVLFVAGVLEDIAKVMTIDFKNPKEKIVLVGTTQSEIGGSEYTKVIYQSDDGPVPKIDFTKAKAVLERVKTAIANDLVTACHDLSKGGLFVALTEMAIAGNLGYNINLTRVPADTNREDIKLFSETYGRFLLTTTEEHLGELVAHFAEKQLPATYIGEVTREPTLKIIENDKSAIIKLSLDEIKKGWQNRMAIEMDGKD